ncbi:MAG: PQQ-binding-like beta-propeller repeat protein [Gemmatales bacterium]|nr:PQQ-like beta-propeller repeat protein [Gemmatales bacterium]MDW7995762.1 PQQ-binding-like beta-propeller repeat protein [Gemmatales bacterium]
MKNAILIFLALMTSSLLWSADWPHWLGPARNGSSPETKLLTQWPAQGPPLLWKVEGGEGYSSVVVAQGRAFTLVQRNDREIVLCLDAASGRTLWTYEIGPGFHNEYGSGPRSTPAVDGERVYVTSVNGPVLCLEAATGKVFWQRHLLKDFGAKQITWGMSASPLVEEDLVLVIPGAPTASVAALRKTDGTTVWSAGSDQAAYASPNIVNLEGHKIALFFTANGLHALDFYTGKILWQIPWKTDYGCNICTPLVIGDLVFIASGEQMGCAVFKVSPRQPQLLWESRGPRSVLKTYWANAVHHEGYLYGISGEFSGVLSLNCVELRTGKLIWSEPRFGKAAITLADGHLFIVTKTGDLVLVEASPNGYREKARVKGLLGDNRTVPTISDGRMYLRDRKNIYCLDLRRPG